MNKENCEEDVRKIFEDYAIEKRKLMSIEINIARKKKKLRMDMIVLLNDICGGDVEVLEKLLPKFDNYISTLNFFEAQ